jgi:hypothetical protein
LLQKLNFLELKTKKFNISLILRLYLFKRIKGINQHTALQNYLRNHKVESLELGIKADDNDNLIIPPKRTFNNYLSQYDKKSLDEIVELILSEAAKNNVLLDLEIVKKTIGESAIIKKKDCQEAIRLSKRLVFPKVNMKIHHNAKYSTKDLLNTLTHIAMTHDFTHNGSITFEDMYPNSITPSSDTLLHHFSKFGSQEEIMKISDDVLDLILRFLKKEYKILQSRKVNIAFDMHDIEFYGKGIAQVCSGKEKNGTTRFFRFLTCSIVAGGKRFIVNIQPVNPLSKVDKLLDESICKVKKKIRINQTYLDRGFDRINVIKVLEKHRLNFIIPKIRSKTVKAWFDKAEGSEAYIVEDFKIGNNKNFVKTNLVIVNDEEGIKRAFICNFPVATPIAYRLYFMYSKRWGIETSYRNLSHDLKPRTTSKNYLIRLFILRFLVFSTICG